MPRSAKFDAVRIAKLSVNLTESQATIEATAAFVNTKTGATHGYTTGRSWSADTNQKLVELKALMERDLELQHFADGNDVTPTTGSGGLAESFKGLGENFGSAGDDVPQT